MPQKLLDALPQIVSEIEYCTCFISYGEPDREFAEKLRDDLVARGVPCWLFSLDRTPGQPLDMEVEQNIQRADKMIVVCSQKSLVREGVLNELKKQVNKSVDDIVPVSLDNRWQRDDFPVEWQGQNLKPFLTRQIYADFSESKYEEELERLLKGLQRQGDS